ncbi:MAG: MGMT family protein [Nostocoides sp.]
MAGLPTPYAERVLDLVASIPAGAVLTYGDVAELVGGGPRAVGTVMARFGSGVPWWRVIRADGRLPSGHEEQALDHHLSEGTPLRSPPGRADAKVDLAQARWRRPPGWDSSATPEWSPMSEGADGM